MVLVLLQGKNSDGTQQQSKWQFLIQESRKQEYSSRNKSGLSLVSIKSPNAGVSEAYIFPFCVVYFPMPSLDCMLLGKGHALLGKPFYSEFRLF